MRENNYVLLKWMGIVVGGAALLYGILCVGIYAAMRQPPERFGAVMSKVPMVGMMVLPFRPLWMSARRGSLRNGDPAPDFELPTLDRSRTVKLSAECREKPVVLIFGSYT